HRVHRVLRRSPDPQRHRSAGLRLSRDGTARRRTQRIWRLLIRTPAEHRANAGGLASVTERADVVIVGSGFGGSITAWRLAELYRAAGVDPRSIVVLERGRRYRHVDFRQSMDIDHLSDVYTLIQGQGAQVVTANAVGGGSNLYLAASLRAPTETFERRDRKPGDRVPLAINPQRCQNVKWCHTGCIFGAKNSLITNYIAAADKRGVQIRPL